MDGVKTANVIGPRRRRFLHSRILGIPRESSGMLNTVSVCKTPNKVVAVRKRIRSVSRGSDPAYRVARFQKRKAVVSDNSYGCTTEKRLFSRPTTPLRRSVL